MTEKNEPNEPAPEPEATPEPDPTPDPAPDKGQDDKWKAMARKHEDEAKKLRKQLEQLQEQSKTKVDESEVEKAAREAAEKAAEQFGKQLARKEKEAELYKTAAGRFRNPDDALRFIDLDDTDDIPAAIDQLLTERDYLAAPTTTPAGRDAGSKPPVKPKSYADMSVKEYAEQRGMPLPGRRR
jgi:hypothetical protein